ncbi:hypothetical protein [Streptomyces sp. DH12]|uniref:hypothetical protein n=1 Tax=Streptomyces sp. DH12 TaxID=2857010 RepID=UPI001E575C20|nr:hypothetical protein [Streptomyces sp. DH12]
MDTALDGRPRRVHGIQLFVAVLAALATLPALVLGFDADLGGLFLVTALPVAVPLLLLRHRRAFAWTCALLGFALAVWGFVGAMAGMFFFLPSAVLLMIAPAVGPGPGSR